MSDRKEFEGVAGRAVPARPTAAPPGPGAALRASEAPLSALVSAMGLVWRTDASGCSMFMDDWIRYTGMPLEAIRSLGWTRAIHPDDLPAMMAAWQAAVATGTVYESRYRLRRHDGAWRWHDVRGVPVPGPDGRVVEWMGVCIDVEEEAQAEAALRASEARNRALLEHAPEKMWINRPDGTVDYFNAAWRLYAGQPDSSGTAAWVEVVHPEDFPRVRELRTRAVERSEPYELEVRLRRAADGAWRWHQASVAPLRDAAGAISAWVGMAADIDDARRAAESSRRQAALDAYLVGLDGRLRAAPTAREAVTAACEMLGRQLGAALCALTEVQPDGETTVIESEWRAGDTASAIGTHRLADYGADRVAALLSGAPVVVEDVRTDPRTAGTVAVAAYEALGARASLDVPLQRDGRVRALLALGSSEPRRWTEDEIALARETAERLWDAAERARAEADLRALNATLESRVAERTLTLQDTALALEAEIRRREAAQTQLVQAQRMEALGQVVGGVAHDFNNVLAAVQGAFNILSRRLEDEELRYVIAEGRKAGDRAASLVRQMLAFARRQPIEAHVIDPARLLPELGGVLRHAVGAGISLEFDVAPGVWPVHVDPHQLEVALLNLAINARDAMPAGGRIVLGAANLPAGEGGPGAFDAGDRVEISLEDSGAGMDAATLARAFEPFFTTKPVGQGTGLGLAQVHGFAQASGGEVRAESAPGLGTTISLLLPRSALRPETQPVAEDQAPAPHGGATILLVDDDDQVRPIAAALLRDLGYTVAEAANAAVAMALAQLHPLDLLLTDVAMPGTDGLTLARSLRAERPDLPVLFMTGYAGRHDLAGESVIAKPFTVEEVGRRVLAALGRPGAA